VDKVKIVRGLWNDEFLRVLENFPAAKHDDEVDALSGAHELLTSGSRNRLMPNSVRWWGSL
jgi:phage terminase large subunit-like protein